MASRKSDLRNRVSPAKAREILRDGEILGKPLTKKSKRFFGVQADRAKRK